MNLNDDQFFTVEEAFQRLGRNLQKGCLVVLNHHEAVHIFVEGGMVVEAFGNGKKGELALAHALHLQDSSYVWFKGAAPEVKSILLDISAYGRLQGTGQIPVPVSHVPTLGSPLPASTGPLRPTSLTTTKQLKSTVPLLAKFEKGARKTMTLPNAGYYLDVQGPTTTTFKMIKPTMIAGRNEDCDISLDDGEAKISRKHFMIQVSDAGVFVKDLDSTNGTYLNGDLIDREIMIQVGDQVGMGAYTLALQREKSRAPAMP